VLPFEVDMSSCEILVSVMDLCSSSELCSCCVQSKLYTVCTTCNELCLHVQRKTHSNKIKQYASAAQQPNMCIYSILIELLQNHQVHIVKCEYLCMEAHRSIYAPHFLHCMY
jgi:hypothetical protein